MRWLAWPGCGCCGVLTALDLTCGVFCVAAREADGSRAARASRGAGTYHTTCSVGARLEPVLNGAASSYQISFELFRDPVVTPSGHVYVDSSDCMPLRWNAVLTPAHVVSRTGTNVGASPSTCDAAPRTR